MIAILLVTIVALLFFVGRSFFTPAGSVRPKQKSGHSDPTAGNIGLWAASPSDDSHHHSPDCGHHADAGGHDCGGSDAGGGHGGH